MDLDLDLDGKAAIITGTINPWGIGAATASAFAAESVKLV
jgi:NAD(P)-dependent dehydrogenase (short-subunit alcohol dehydrogenase family)